ncbi:uncharacterized protein VTP21DRAFT_7644 [Calcarisporiella thermophila]|uniref:uncharacterized protein n=1 Tax=Calcarisporiella thermophila TaxID=911321 RepID=UPI0037433955
MDIVYAQHTFDAENPDEISFARGDKIIVLEKDENFGDGWWLGQNPHGEIGLFPANYASPQPPAQKASSQSQQQQQQQTRVRPLSIVMSNPITQQQSPISMESGSPLGRIQQQQQPQHYQENNYSRQMEDEGNENTKVHSSHSSLTDNLGRDRLSVSNGRPTPPMQPSPPAQPPPPTQPLPPVQPPSQPPPSQPLPPINPPPPPPPASTTSTESKKLSMEPTGARAAAQTISLQTAIRHPSLAGVHPEDWDVQQVSFWLQSMGLNQAAVKFTEHEISGDILLELNLETLKELDISSFGKRYHVMSAINALKQEFNLNSGDQNSISDTRSAASSVRGVPAPSITSPTSPSPSFQNVQRVLTDPGMGRPTSTASVPRSDSRSGRMGASSHSGQDFRGDARILTEAIPEEEDIDDENRFPQAISHMHLNTPPWQQPPLGQPGVSGSSVGSSVSMRQPMYTLQTEPDSRTYISGDSRSLTSDSGPMDPEHPNGHNRFGARSESNVDELHAWQRLPVPTSISNSPSGPKPSGINRLIKNPDYEGWLRKQGGRYKTWSTRWFVLKGSDLYYMKNPKDTRARSHIDLRGYRVVPDERIQAGKYCFKLAHDRERTYNFYCDTEQAMKDWLHALMKATVRRDPNAPVISSCNVKTVPLAVAQQMRPLPPTLNNNPQGQQHTNGMGIKQNRVAAQQPAPLEAFDHFGSPFGSSQPAQSPPAPQSVIEDAWDGEPLDNEIDPDLRPERLRRLAEERKEEEEQQQRADAASRSPGVGADNQLEPWARSRYIRWVNAHLPPEFDQQVTDLTDSFRSGEVLIQLLESVAGKPVNRPDPPANGASNTSPSMLMLENIVAAFRFMDKQGVVRDGWFSVKDVFGGKEDKIIEMLDSIRRWQTTLDQSKKD